MSLKGELITERLDHDGGRHVTAYLPPAPPDTVVFAGDGHLVPGWAASLEAARIEATAIVGVQRADDETVRLHEYSPVFDAERFAAHERFFVEDVGGWARSRLGLSLPPARTAVFGGSAGGELALALGLRHADRFGVILSASPGAGFRPPPSLLGPLPRTYLVAGTLEPFFLENAVRWAAALRAAGADVVLAERVAGHDPAMWQDELPRMLVWAFGA